MENLLINAREYNSNEYTSLDKYNLETKIKILSGNGSIINPYEICIKLKNNNDATWKGIIHFELSINKKKPKFFMPGFLYNRNRGEAPLNVPNMFPRLREGDFNKPASPWLMTRSDRLSHPTTLVYDEGDIYGIISSPYLIYKDNHLKQWQPKNNSNKFGQYCGFSCSLEQGTIGYTLGYEDAPWHFIKSNIVKERSDLSDNCFEIKSHQTTEIIIKVIQSSNHVLSDINKVIELVYWEYHQLPISKSSIIETVQDLANAITKDAYLPNDKAYAGQVFEEPNGTFRMNKILSISWTNGLSVAVPVLIAGLRLNNEEIRKQALDVISNITNNSLNKKTGLPFEACHDGIWSNYGWWFDEMHTPGHSGYLIGQAMYYLLKAYVFEKKIKGIEHKNWLQLAKGVLEKVVPTYNSRFEYPFILSSKTGEGLEYDSLGSSWLLTALSFYAYITKDLSNLDILLKSEKQYHIAYIQNIEGYGGPLDVDKATDSEGVLGYVRAVRYLHLLTGDKKLLLHLRDGLNYEFTFKFCYNSPIKVDPLKKLNWASCGGSITSISNPHIHPMSNTIIDELFYYVAQTGDKYVNSRLNDVINWGSQTYNKFDKEFDYGKKGWMSERFCHSQGLLTQKYPDNSPASTWFCLMPWASASIIEGLVGDLWKN